MSEIDPPFLTWGGNSGGLLLGGGKLNHIRYTKLDIFEELSGRSDAVNKWSAAKNLATLVIWCKTRHMPSVLSKYGISEKHYAQRQPRGILPDIYSSSIVIIPHMQQIERCRPAGAGSVVADVARTGDVDYDGVVC